MPPPSHWLSQKWLLEITSEYVKNNTNNGVFVECGVRRGRSARVIATTLQREGYLFDTWTGFPHYSHHDAFNKDRTDLLNKCVEINYPIYDICKNSLEGEGVLELCHMIQGDICETVPAFVKKSTPRICMLYIDTDLYDPALVSTEYLYPYVVSDGVILFHDYKDPKWPGIAKVVDDFVEKHSWGFVDLNELVNISAAVVINGDPARYRECIEKTNESRMFVYENYISIS